MPELSSPYVSKTTAGHVTQGAASFAGGFVEGMVTEAANQFLFDGAGNFVPKFGSSLASLAPVEFVCNQCDCLFKVTFASNGAAKEAAVKKWPMPDSIIEGVKSSFIQERKKKRPYISAVVWSLLTLYCIIIFFMSIANESIFAGGAQFTFGLIFGIIFAIPAIVKIRKISSLNNEIETAESQSLRDFKQSHRDLFAQYSQYN